MYYKEFKNMHELYKDTENDRFQIKLVEAKKPDMWSRMRNPEVAGQEDQTVVVLKDKEKREIVMSDSWMEQKTNIELVRKANGHVLIGGLGIGMIILAIQDKVEVESITIVELNKELHDLVMPFLSKHFNNKVRIIISDIHHYIPDIKFDTIYCDIWNDISSDNWDEMKKLTKKFKYKLNRRNKNSILDHWRKKDTQKMYYE